MNTSLRSHPAATRHRLFAVGLVLVLLAAAGMARAQDNHGVCRVTTSGQTTYNGAAWSSPMDLQTALDTSGCSEIWVAAGVYKPVAPADPAHVTSSERAASFQILPAVALYGGFDGSETERAQRDWTASPTVLSGDIDNNDAVNAAGVDEDYNAITGSNSYHVVYLNGAAAPILPTTSIDGFIITGGAADQDSAARPRGGGLDCEAVSTTPGAVCSPTVRNVVFRGNRASSGGGMASYVDFMGNAANAALTDVTFRANYAEEEGGGLFSEVDDRGFAQKITELRTVLERVQFTNNQADRGGAVLTVALGTAIAAPTFNEVVFDDNHARSFGGAVYNQTFSGGVCHPLLTNVTFHANHAGSSGGAVFNKTIYYGVTSPVFRNVTFADNHAGDKGGAMDNSPFTGVPDQGVDITLDHVTMARNSAGTQGGGINNVGPYQTDPPSLYKMTLSNVILWGNSAPTHPGMANTRGAAPSIDHSIIQGSGGSIAWDPAVGIDGGYNQDVDPLLGALSEHGGFTQTLLPASNSPAIDAGTCGDQDSDQRGVSRPQGLTCEIGSVEVPVVAFLQPIYGDGQNAPLWHDFANPLIVQARGLDNLPAPGVKIKALPAQAGRPAAVCSGDRTDSNGLAYLYCRANGQAGAYSLAINAVNVFAGATPTTSFSLTNVDDGDTIFRNGFDQPGPRTLMMPPTGAGTFALASPGHLVAGEPEPVAILTNRHGKPLVRVDALREGGKLLWRTSRYDAAGLPVPDVWQQAGKAPILRVQRSAKGIHPDLQSAVH